METELVSDFSLRVIGFLLLMASVALGGWTVAQEVFRSLDSSQLSRELVRGGSHVFPRLLRAFGLLATPLFVVPLMVFMSFSTALDADWRETALVFFVICSLIFCTFSLFCFGALMGWRFQISRHRAREKKKAGFEALMQLRQQLAQRGK